MNVVRFPGSLYLDLLRSICKISTQIGWFFWVNFGINFTKRHKFYTQKEDPGIHFCVYMGV